jgi:hypothetical protein
VNGLVASFWWPSNEDFGQKTISELELKSERMCVDCEHEWDADEVEEKDLE